MIRKSLLMPAVTVYLASAAIAFSQASVATDPVGFTTASCLAGSDTYVSLAFTRPPEFTGTIQSVSGSPTLNTITLNGSPGWAANRFVYSAGTQPNHYYVLLGAGGPTNGKEGHTFLITGNTASALTLDTTLEDLSGVTAGTSITMIPYWTPATVFPASDKDVSFTATTSTAAYKTQLRIPAVAAAGVYSFPTTYFYSSNVDGSTSGWRVVGDNTTDHADDILLPDTYFVVRNDNGAPTLALTPLGSVAMKRVTAPVFTASSQSLDNPVAMVRPVDVSLNQSGFGPADRSFVPGDQLLLFDNAQAAFNKTPSTTYTYDNAWRISGDTVTDHGTDVIPAGSAVLVRKASFTAGTAFWFNTPTYASGFAIRPVQLVSRLNHMNVGAFDVNLFTIGIVGVEPRKGGTIGKDFTLLATFPLPLTAAPGVNPPTSADGLATADSPTFTNVNGRGIVTVNLHNVANIQTLSATLTGVTDSTNSGNVTIPMGILLGDVNATKLVDGNDVSAVQGHTRQKANLTNFRNDVDCSGLIDGNDVSTTQRQSRTFIR